MTTTEPHMAGHEHDYDDGFQHVADIMVSSFYDSHSDGPESASLARVSTHVRRECDS